MAASEVATPLLPMATFLRVLGLFGGFPLVPSNQVHYILLQNLCFMPIVTTLLFW